MSQELAASMQYAESLLKGRDPEGALKDARVRRSPPGRSCRGRI